MSLTEQQVWFLLLLMMRRRRMTMTAIASVETLHGHVREAILSFSH